MVFVAGNRLVSRILLSNTLRNISQRISWDVVSESLFCFHLNSVSWNRPIFLSKFINNWFLLLIIHLWKFKIIFFFFISNYYCIVWLNIRKPIRRRKRDSRKMILWNWLEDYLWWGWRSNLIILHIRFICHWRS
jgi:hypothetical protein